MNNMIEICHFIMRKDGIKGLKKTNARGETPLILAIKHCSYKCIRLLISAG